MRRDGANNEIACRLSVGGLASAASPAPSRAPVEAEPRGDVAYAKLVAKST